MHLSEDILFDLLKFYVLSLDDALRIDKRHDIEDAISVFRGEFAPPPEQQYGPRPR